MSTTTNKALITAYSVGATLATTAVTEGVLINYTPVGDSFLAGDGSSQSVDRANISFDPGLGQINYSRVNTTNATTLNTLTVSPNYEFKPIVGSPETRDGEARTNLTYQTLLTSLGDTVDSGDTFDTVSELENKPNGFLGVQYSPLLGDTYYGWIKYSYNGTDVNVGTIVFETTPDLAVTVGAIPESSEVMMVLGGILTGGLLGVRRLRARKKEKTA
ncbi:hypothetical protein [Cerasicoccus arenae]|uniref:Uncharacterized protein n=1 Tax=Cerasicoccus arenae TaxID=424488 RepID=A0A8J3GG99_9BACT|nr:hypothetical protein [Cerasicoccus arenae]MBK1856655.1 hypothetical protein [Cerasicoccus arenae]GHC12203.1 hypothetical protein GCM10007047_31910 [Cerasicoccus arenae]